MPMIVKIACVIFVIVVLLFPVFDWRREKS